MNIIGKSLFSHSQQQLLNLFFLQPDTSFYFKEIIRKTHLGVASAKRELGRLYEADILVRNVIGNQHHYQANREGMVYDEIVSIVKKAQGLSDYLACALEPVMAQVDVAYYYPQNDELEVVIISDTLTYSQSMDRVLPAEQQLKQQINPTVLTWREWHHKVQRKPQLRKQVLAKETLFIKGDSSLLER